MNKLDCKKCYYRFMNKPCKYCIRNPKYIDYFKEESGK
jgi:hypothetical protein